MRDAADLLLLLLYAPGKGNEGEPIEGITRIQKLVFLLQQGEGPGEIVDEASKLGFVPYKMGPYSTELRSMLEELEMAGIVDSRRLEYLIADDSDQEPGENGSARRKVESRRYRLSELGMKIGADLWSRLSDSEQEDLRRFKAFFNSLTLRQLLVFTYERYPTFTTESTIKGALGIQ